jgi:hypothetical protein
MALGAATREGVFDGGPRSGAISLQTLTPPELEKLKGVNRD